MKKVALRRKEQPRQPHPNGRQLPIFLANLEISNDTLGPESDGDNSNTHIVDAECDNRYQFETGINHLKILGITYPSIMTECNLCFLDLSLLASLDVGRYTGQRLLENPHNLPNFLGGSNWSYSSYIPSLYEHSVLIRYSTNCVLARVRGILSPEDRWWETYALLSYSKALSKLQQAINSVSKSPTAEVLCATQILGLYEVRYHT